MKTDPLLEKSRRLRAQRLAAQTQTARKILKAVVKRAYPVLDFDDEIRFGIHKGKSLRDVIEDDPGWVRWALENISTFDISDAAVEVLENTPDARRVWED